MTTNEPSTTAATKPTWVRLALWKVDTKAMAVGCALFAAALGTIGAIYGALVDPRFLIAGLMYLAALWYWAAIRWMNSNRAW